VNVLFQEEDDELNQAIRRAEKAIAAAGLGSDTDVGSVIQAALERARMGRISQLMREGFAHGLELSSRYDSSQAQDLARRIVNSTHDVRHRAIIDQFAWTVVTPNEGNHVIDSRIFDEFGDTDPFQEAPPPPATRAGTSLLSQLVPHAQISCAYVLAARLGPHRAT